MPGVSSAWSAKYMAVHAIDVNNSDLSCVDRGLMVIYNSAVR